MLGEILGTLYARESEYNDLDREYGELVSDHVSAWESCLEAKARSSRGVQTLVEFADRAIVGAASGTVVGFVKSGEPHGALAGGTLGGLVGPMVQMLYDLGRDLGHRRDLISLRHHFLALDSTRR